MLKTSNTIDLICQEIKRSNKIPVLIFDRDGTLVPITDDPALAVFDPRVRQSLNKLAGSPNTHVGLLSARSLYQLQKDLPEGKHILAGNYGLEIYTPGGALFCHNTARDSRKFFESAMHSFEQELSPEYQVIFEDHGLSLCLHWHRTPENLLVDFHTIVSKIAETCPQLHFKTLNTSYEIWPAIEWDKAHGMSKILELLQINPDEALLLFAGDSLMDEPAFSWVNEYEGISLLIGRRETSEAHYSFATPAELHQLISRLAQTLLVAG